MRKKHSILLALVVFLAVFLRFWQLAEVPPSLSWDEVAIGYNAWSILKTGKDEYGWNHPLLFRSFDDYKLPGMVYSVALSEKIFGLNELAVRFPSALFGVLIVITGYFLVKELLDQKAALLASLLLAINPWLVNFSRQCFESNGSLFFVMLGTYLLIKTKKQKFLFLPAIISFAVSFYFYYATRLVVPFLILTFIIAYFKWVKNNLKIFVGSGLLGFILLLPILPSIFSFGGFSRINQVAITDDPFYLLKKEEYAKLNLVHHNSFLSKAIYNRRIALAETFFFNYFKNLSSEFIFLNGTYQAGLLYLWELPFFLSGFYFLFRQKGEWKWLIFIWFVTYPLAAAATKDQPNALRALIGAPVISLISFFGLYQIWQLIKKSKSSFFLVVIWILVAVFSFIRFTFSYFDYSTEIKALDFGDGYKDLAQFLTTNKNNYSQIWVTGAYWRPYIHLLFHLKYEPTLYQKNGNREGFDMFHFGKASWDNSGIDLGTANLQKLNLDHSLFILSNKEYQAKLNAGIKFSKSTPISGKFTRDVFWAVEL